MEIIAKFCRGDTDDSSSPEQILHRGAGLSEDILGTNTSFYGIVGPRKDLISIRFVGSTLGDPATLEVAANDHLFGDATQKREPTVVVLANDSSSPVERNLIEKGHALVVKMPIRSGDRLVGVLGALLPEVRELDSEEWACLDVLSQMIAMKQEIAGINGKPTGDSPATAAASPTDDAARQRERRRHARNRYRFVQYIAPIRDSTRPNLKDFIPVECRDISESGVAFLLPAAPDFDKLLIALGRPPVFVHCLAEVVRTERVRTDRGPKVLTGCRFLKRVAF